MRLHLLSVLSVFAVRLLDGLAIPSSDWDDVHPKHTWYSVPDSWHNLGHPPADTTIDIHVALQAQDENALIDALYDVSSPGHPKYGAHLSKEEVAELVAPSPYVLELVNAWLDHHGILPSTVSTKHGGSWLMLSGVPVSQANRLLRASYQLYHHIGTNETVLRTLSYALPGALLEKVQTVIPTTHFGFPRAHMPKSVMRRGGAAPAGAVLPAPSPVPSSGPEPVTPALLRWMYNISGYYPAAVDQNTLGVTGFLDQYPNPDDLRRFMNEYRSDGTYATYTVMQIKGGSYHPSSPGDEASLNIQYAEAITYPTPITFYSTSGASYEDDMFFNWLDFMRNQPSVPQTVTMSYGSSESRIPPDYARKVCNLFAEIGARGSTVLLASGDHGVGEGNCRFDDSFGNSYVLFSPAFPASCPWVTSVGGTTGYKPEVAASFSGGGFSIYFPRQPYQDHAVSTFLQNLGTQYYGLYNPGGRGVPDIAVQAIDFDFFLDNRLWYMDGTSCSTPVAASIISLLNDYRLSKGMRPFGFLNPWLYTVGLAGLRDITSGSNPGCNTDGFSATPGWDPVTGLGSLNFDRLEEILDDV
ncbi:subtilisin-like protein [Lactarius quietus]|nr:subtilisin-like protein [Lactarius quietus]